MFNESIRHRVRAIIGGVLALSLAIMATSPLPAVAQGQPNDQLEETAVNAYVYAYPLVLMEISRRAATNVSEPVGFFAPMNQFAHLRSFPDHEFRAVVRPNADTFYSTIWFDVTDEPIVISIPSSEGRYYMLPMLDMWTDVFASPGSRTSGTAAATFAVVGPDWQGDLPQGVESIRSPTSIGWIIGRTEVDGPEDAVSVHRFQDAMTVRPLSEWGNDSYRRRLGQVDPTWDTKTPPPVQAAQMSAAQYFELFAALLIDNPPHEMDWNTTTQLRRVGIVPGEELHFAGLTAEVKQALEQAVSAGQGLIASHRGGEMINGWSVSRQLMGSYGTSYLHRAYIAMIGLGANLPEDAIYPMSLSGLDGEPYHGDNNYVLHFGRGELPPVNGFWSLAMYDAEGYFVENPIGRYSIGNRDDLSMNEDGSLDLYLQHQSPGSALESNWLPAPAGQFNLVLRLYWPGTEIITGEWQPPAVRVATKTAAAYR